VLLLAGFWIHFGSPEAFPADGRFVASALCAMLFAGLMVAWCAEKLTAQWLLSGAIVLLIAELSMSALLPFPSKLSEERPGAYRMRFAYADMAEFVKALPGQQRGMVNGDEIAIAIGDLYQVPMFEGFTASVPSTIWDLGMARREVLELYGVKAWIGSSPLYEGQQQVAAFQSGAKAWEIEGAFPRVWIAHQTESFDTVAAFRARFDEGAFATTQVAPFVGAAPQVPACSEQEAAADEASITGYRMNTVLIRARSACGGLLVLSDNDFPGWEAYVDGQRVEILRPFHALRGVVISPGEHTVMMKYAPSSVRNGALLSLLGLFSLSGLAWWDWRRSRVSAAVQRANPSA
jgi:hypothetical protein